MKIVLTGRNSSFEILRLAAMFIIICHHFVVHGIYPVISPNDVYNVSMALCVLLFGWGGYLGNSIFILLTGYFSVNKKVNGKRLFLLALAMMFYSIVIALIWKYNGWQIPHKREILLPFFYGKNWFVSCYLIFMLFVPFINRAILRASSVQHLMLVILLFSLELVVPVLKGANFMNGSPLFQFLLFYLIGAYLKRFPFQHTALNRQVTWIKASILLLILQIATIAYTWLFQHDIWRFVNLFSACLAVAYFMVAKTHKSCCIPSVNKLAASVLGVYLIHDNDLVRSFIWKSFFPNAAYFDTSYFVLFLLVKVCCIYGFCLLIDQIRIWTIENKVKKLVNRHWDQGTIMFSAMKRKTIIFLREL